AVAAACPGTSYEGQHGACRGQVPGQLIIEQVSGHHAWPLSIAVGHRHAADRLTKLLEATALGPVALVAISADRHINRTGTQCCGILRAQSPSVHAAVTP